MIFRALAFATLFAACPVTIHAQSLAGGEIEERLVEKPNASFVSRQLPEALELCVADALSTRGVFPHVYHRPGGGLFVTVIRATVIVKPHDGGSQLLLNTRGNNDERITDRLIQCL